MKTVLDTSDRPAHDALVEKKSEFIADVCHVDALDEALLFVDSVRQLHPKARHVAYAAICVDGDGRVRERMSDDGEPSGTAGKPILDVLRQGDLMNCAVTVTRYFGGILLGSGGLIRPPPRWASRWPDWRPSRRAADTRQRCSTRNLTCSVNSPRIAGPRWRMSGTVTVSYWTRWCRWSVSGNSSGACVRRSARR